MNDPRNDSGAAPESTQESDRSHSPASRTRADQGREGNREGSREQGKEHGFKSSSEGPSGIATTREDGQTDADPFLALYSVNSNRLVRIGSYHSRINDVMRQFRWATLERGDGWYFPEPYLSRVELALCGVDITLANRDGSPTPMAAAAERREDNEHTKRILAEQRAARDAAAADPLAIRDAREQCKRAYAEAIAARHPEPEPADDATLDRATGTP